VCHKGQSIITPPPLSNCKYVLIFQIESYLHTYHANPLFLMRHRSLPISSFLCRLLSLSIFCTAGTLFRVSTNRGIKGLPRDSPLSLLFKTWFWFWYLQILYNSARKLLMCVCAFVCVWAYVWVYVCVGVCVEAPSNCLYIIGDCSTAQQGSCWCPALGVFTTTPDLFINFSAWY